jgi:alpha-1,3/alpha-1,6-mannosyltransferase
MSLGLPVIAVNSGGPTESVAHYKTGFLCNQDPAEFAQAMWELSSFNVESGWLALTLITCLY